jgi:hypothetical protein
MSKTGETKKKKTLIILFILILILFISILIYWLNLKEQNDKHDLYLSIRNDSSKPQNITILVFQDLKEIFNYSLKLDVYEDHIFKNITNMIGQYNITVYSDGKFIVSENILNDIDLIAIRIVIYNERSIIYEEWN